VAGADPPPDAPAPPSSAAPRADAMALLGRAVADALAGRPAEVALQRDDGFLVEQPVAAFIDASAGPHEEALLTRARGAVLDAGCGAGRLASRLAAAGLAVTGIDVSPALVAAARSRGLAAARVGDVLGDLGGPWDAILLGGNNVGIGGSLAGAGRLLAHLAAALRPGGAILLTSLDATRTTEPVHLAYLARNRAAGRDAGAVRLRVVYRGERGPWFEWLHVAPEELAAIAAAAGLATEIVAPQPDGAYAAVLQTSSSGERA
jgi:SAM-dependent methyltransferase